MGLVGAGAVSGAAAGTLGLTIALMIGVPWSLPDILRLLGTGFIVGGFFGAPLGAIAAPVLGWTLLRRVPLGRMFTLCVAGATIGGIVGWFATAVRGDVVLNSLAGALIGCVVAAINMWHRSRANTLEA